MKHLWSFITDMWFPIVAVILIASFVTIGVVGNKDANPALKEYKDGIQNHLVWSNTGKCFFVRPNDDVTVYLIQVPDCNKGN